MIILILIATFAQSATTTAPPDTQDAPSVAAGLKAPTKPDLLDLSSKEVPVEATSISGLSGRIIQRFIIRRVPSTNGDVFIVDVQGAPLPSPLQAALIVEQLASDDRARKVQQASEETRAIRWQ